MQKCISLPRRCGNIAASVPTFNCFCLDAFSARKRVRSASFNSCTSLWEFYFLRWSGTLVFPSQCTWSLLGCFVLIFSVGLFYLEIGISRCWANDVRRRWAKNWYLPSRHRIQTHLQRAEIWSDLCPTFHSRVNSVFTAPTHACTDSPTVHINMIH